MHCGAAEVFKNAQLVYWNMASSRVGLKIKKCAGKRRHTAPLKAGNKAAASSLLPL